MPVHPPLVFNDISPDKYAKLGAKARAAGIDINGNTGNATKYGVQVEWNYMPAEQQLTFQCLKTPFFVKAADVHAKIQTLVQQTLASA
ncbi:MAG TPA: hypothetical protein VHZ28_16560 [Terracidiphilus sp.]|jgi:hypothetical protein|nr:hypothetical protein [Terracidiphilus sp.]